MEVHDPVLTKLLQQAVKKAKNVQSMKFPGFSERLILTAENEQIRADFEHETVTRRSLAKQLAEERRDTASLRAELKQTQADLARTTRERDGLNAECTQLTTDLTWTTRQRDMLQEEVGELGPEIDELLEPEELRLKDNGKSELIVMVHDAWSRLKQKSGSIASLSADAVASTAAREKMKKTTDFHLDTIMTLCATSIHQMERAVVVAQVLKPAADAYARFAHNGLAVGYGTEALAAEALTQEPFERRPMEEYNPARPVQPVAAGHDKGAWAGDQAVLTWANRCLLAGDPDARVVLGVTPSEIDVYVSVDCHRWLLTVNVDCHRFDCHRFDCHRFDCHRFDCHPFDCHR